MANLTKNTIHKTEPRAGRKSFIVLNATTLYAGALVGLDAAGYLTKWADTTGLRFVGLLLEGAVGNTSATPKVEGRVNTGGQLIKDATVASLTQADVNALVYCATDNPADFTLTPPTNVKAIGYVSRFTSAGVGDVTLFTPEEYLGNHGIVGLTDNSGGTAADTIAAIGAAYSQAEVRNAVASLAAKINALISR